MDKGKFFSGLFIMVGLVVLGLMIPRAVEKFRSYDRTVNVKGLCEVEVKADKVIWPIVYKVMSNDIQSIYDQTDASNATIMAFLKDGGVSVDEISVSVPQISDKLANEYGDNNRAFRYIATNVVTVCTEDVEGILPKPILATPALTAPDDTRTTCTPQFFISESTFTSFSILRRLRCPVL